MEIMESRKSKPEIIRVRGLWLGELRRAQVPPMTLAALAPQVQLTAGRISLIERSAEINITRRAADRFAATFGVSLEDLVTEAAAQPTSSPPLPTTMGLIERQLTLISEQLQVVVERQSRLEQLLLQNISSGST